MASHTSLISQRPRASVLQLALILTVLSAYLVTGILDSSRISPGLFFTITLCLALATFHPNIRTASVCIAGVITAELFITIDHIHGSCGYEVLRGAKSWHKSGLGDLGYYRECSQPATAFWLLMLVGILWTIIFISELWRIFAPSKQAIHLPDAPSEADQQ